MVSQESANRLNSQTTQSQDSINEATMEIGSQERANVERVKVAKHQQGPRRLKDLARAAQKAKTAAILEKRGYKRVVVGDDQQTSAGTQPCGDTIDSLTQPTCSTISRQEYIRNYSKKRRDAMLEKNPDEARERENAYRRELRARKKIMAQKTVSPTQSSVSFSTTTCIQNNSNKNEQGSLIDSLTKPTCPTISRQEYRRNYSKKRRDFMLAKNPDEAREKENAYRRQLRARKKLIAQNTPSPMQSSVSLSTTTCIQNDSNINGQGGSNPNDRRARENAYRRDLRARKKAEKEARVAGVKTDNSSHIQNCQELFKFDSLYP